MRSAASAALGGGPRAGQRLVGRRLVRRRAQAAARSGGGSGSGGGGTDLGSGGGQSNIDRKRSQQYLDCLTAAKKPADIEKCAAILEK